MKQIFWVIVEFLLPFVIIGCLVALYMGFMYIVVPIAVIAGFVVIIKENFK